MAVKLNKYCIWYNVFNIEGKKRWKFNKFKIVEASDIKSAIKKFRQIHRTSFPNIYIIKIEKNNKSGIPI